MKRWEKTSEKAVPETSKFDLEWRFDLYPKVFLKGFDSPAVFYQLFCVCLRGGKAASAWSGVGVNAQIRPGSSRTLTGPGEKETGKSVFRLLVFQNCFHRDPSLALSKNFRASAA